MSLYGDLHIANHELHVQPTYTITLSKGIYIVLVGVECKVIALAIILDTLSNIIGP